MGTSRFLGSHQREAANRLGKEREKSNRCPKCSESLKRYSNSFSEVHRWMDEPCLILGASHRKYRHDPNVTPFEAKVIFGDMADHVCLDHIRLDELESRKSITTSGSQTQITMK